MTDDIEKKPESETASDPVNENPASTDVADSADPFTVPNTSQNPAASNGGNRASWLSGLLFTAIIIALGLSGYAHWWQYQQAEQQQQSLEQQTEQLQEQLTQQTQQLQQTRNQQAVLRQQLAEQSQAVDEALQQQSDAHNVLAQQLDAQNQRLLQLSSANSENWELAEALYLTRLANQRLVMEQNREAALALLEGADEILGRQQNPELFPVRETLNQDITALKVVKAVDREGLFLQLSALHEQLQHLTLTETLNFKTRTENDLVNPEPEEDKNVWQKITGSFQNTFGRLENYVRKVDLEGPVKPLLAPDEQDSIRLAVNLYLESAQIALLRGQGLAFKNALEQAERQINTYFPETSQRQELLLALESLREESVVPELPDISRSYLRLNDYIQSRSQESISEQAGTGEKP